MYSFKMAKKIAIKTTVWALATVECVILVYEILSHAFGPTSNFAYNPRTYNSNMNTSLHQVTLIEKKVKPGIPPHVFYLDKEPLSGNITKKIMIWMDRSGAKCGMDMEGTLCPCVPPGLKGKMLVDLNMSSSYSWKEVSIIAQTGNLMKGGVWEPHHCQARKKFLIVIPYRDREIHLKSFLAHMHPILQRQMLSYRVIVVEQRQPVLFNKAAMMNAAYKEATKRGLGPFDCVLFHDIDLLMEDDRNMMICGKRPVHYGVYLDRVGYRQCCGMLFGGAVSLTWEQFHLVNGYSNTFFGWGGEDDNMYYRVRNMGWNKAIAKKEYGRYSSLKHTRDKGNPRNWKNYKLSYNKNVTEGLSTLQYTVIEYKEIDLYTWILVDLNVTGLPYPDVGTSFYFSKIPGECSNGETLSTISASTIAQCQDFCGQNSQCSAFVLQTNGTRSLVCVMKKEKCQNISASVNSTTYLRGVDIQLESSNVSYEVYSEDCKGNDFQSIRGSSASVCAAKCNMLEKCKAFVFTQTSNKCWLKYSCVPPKLTFKSRQIMTYVKTKQKH